MLRFTSVAEIHPDSSTINESTKNPANGFRYSTKYLPRYWRTPLLLASIFICIHITVVILFSEESSKRNILIKKVKLTASLDPSQEKQNLRPQKRFVQSESSNLAIELPETEDNPMHRSRTEEEDDTVSISKTSIDRKVCQSGHIQGLSSFCIDQPCLHQLKDFDGYPVPQKKLDALRERSVENILQSKLQYELKLVQGSFDPVNFPILSLLTNIQKQLGAYGSVGLVQTNLDKFSSIVATTVDRQIGEKLIVVHPFNSSVRPFFVHSGFGSLPGMPSDKELYKNHLKKLGFIGEYEEGQNRYSGDSFYYPDFHLYDESTTDIPKENLLKHRIPQFRIVSLASDQLTMMSGLQTAACSLRDGGIVILNFPNVELYTLSSLKTLLENRFGNALSILVATSSKIYITTTNWKTKYINLIVEHSTSLQSGLTTFDTSTGYYMQS